MGMGLLSALPHAGSAQAASTGTPPAISAPKEGASDYQLGAEDVIEITVRNHNDLNKSLTIPPDGKIDFPEVGQIQAAGKTPRALAAELQEGIEKTRNNVAVTITVKEVHSRRVRVLGAVKAPGVFDLKRRMRLVDLVATAGGLSAKSARISARIIRNSTKVIPLDLAQALAAPDSSANVELEPDDMILFDEVEVARSQAFVLGQVTRPGNYDIDPDTTLLSLLSLAGSPTEHAALTKAYLMRGGTRIPINLRLPLVEGKTEETVTKFKIQSGDLLFVPENEERYAVMGQVGKPGYYPLPEKGEVTLLEAINLAGGQGSGGDLSKAGIIRILDGKATVQPVNITNMLKKGSTTGSLVLHTGDILYVPERQARHGFSWQDLLTPLSALSFLGIRLGR
jgi:polysaccharide export outer membrane protein